MKRQLNNPPLLFEALLVTVLITCIPLLLAHIFIPSNMMFDFHDSSQAPRISEFIFNINTLHIPPRIAPHWSFELSFPVFNYYAPFSYWVTSIIALMTSIAASIKLSFLLATVIGCIGMYLLIRLFTTMYGALAGAALYISSPYIAVETLIRGNLGEIWYIALLPWSIFSLIFLSRSPSYARLALCAILLSFVFTVHNVLSLVSVPLLILFAILIPNKKWSISAIALALGLSSYFLFPAVFELSLTHAREIAQNTYYGHHFLCLYQLWYSQWGYGGSVAGCTQDGMSFMMGKPQIILGITGGILYIVSTIRKKRMEPILLLFFILTLLATFLTTYSSAAIWALLSPILSLFQFPWRLLIFTLFGISFFGGLMIGRMPLRIGSVFTLFLVAYLFINHAKFFQKVEMPVSQFNNEYLSSAYIKTRVAYKIPEYLPKSVDYKTWLSYEPNATHTEQIDQSLMKQEFIHPLFPGSRIITNTLYQKSAILTPGVYTVNIHSFPNWQMTLDNRIVQSYNTDRLGRPLIIVSSPASFELKYVQTPIQHIGNTVTIASIGIIIFAIILFKKKKYTDLVQ